MTDYKVLIERLRNPARRINWADREEAAEVIEKLMREIPELPIPDITRQLFYIPNNGGHND